jgi:holin-like protein
MPIIDVQIIAESVLPAAARLISISFMQPRSAAPARPWPRRLLLTIIQTLFFVAAWLAADFVARRFGIHIPASVLAIATILALLFSGVLKPHHIHRGANFLLAEMLLFFVPAFVAAITQAATFASQGFRLIASVALGTAIVMIGTVWTVDRVFHWESTRR